jgi:hypothetical protein
MPDYKIIPILKGGVCIGLGLAFLVPHKEMHVPEPGPQLPIAGKPVAVLASSTAALGINPIFLPLK